MLQQPMEKTVERQLFPWSLWTIISAHIHSATLAGAQAVAGLIWKTAACGKDLCWIRGKGMRRKKNREDVLQTKPNPHSLSPCTAQVEGDRMVRSEDEPRRKVGKWEGRCLQFWFYFSLSYFAIKNCVKPPGQVCFVHDNNSWTMSLSSSWTTRSFILFCPVFPRQQAKVNPAQSTQQEPSLPFQLEPIGGIFPPLQVPVSYFPPFSFWSALHSLAWKKMSKHLLLKHEYFFSRWDIHNLQNIH